MAHNDLILLDPTTSVDPYAVVAVFADARLHGRIVVVLEGGEQLTLYNTTTARVTETINNAINADYEE